MSTPDAPDAPDETAATAAGSPNPPAQDPADPTTQPSAPNSAAPGTDVTESDPNADSEVGVAGDMGVSSERLGTVRGGDEEVTYGTAPTYVDPADVGAPTGEDVPPEQAARDGRPEVQPDNDVTPHPRNPDGNPRHGI